MTSPFRERLLVASNVEDQTLSRERAKLTRERTPAELAEFHGVGDIPIPGLWAHSTTERDRKSVKGVSERFKKPAALTRPCVVRSKVSCKTHAACRLAIIIVRRGPGTPLPTTVVYRSVR